MATEDKHLHNLNELSDYKVADGYNNVKGWEVKDKDNRVIGKVENLLVNLDEKRVVYLDVEVDQSIIDAKYDPYTNPNNPEVREFVNNDGQNHIIIPIGLVDIDEERNYVHTETVDHRTFAETKRYRSGDNIDRDYEVAVLDSYSRKDVENLVSEEKVREIVREEVRDMGIPNPKETELRDEGRIRDIVRDEVKSNETTVSDLDSPTTTNDRGYIDVEDGEALTEKRERLHRDDFDRETNKKGLDFDHDNDGNPNITDPDYYQKKGRDIKNADYDNDNDGNPNLTDPDYYEEKGRKIKNADYDNDNDGNSNVTDPGYYDEKGKGVKGSRFDNDNDGNPNITDPDYYEEKGRDVKNADYDHDNDGVPNIVDPDYYEDKLKGRDSESYDDDDFYKRREFDDSRRRRK